MKKIRIFETVAISLFLLYIGIMVLATIYAFNRKSGVTGLDMNRIQKMHFEAISNVPKKE